MTFSLKPWTGKFTRIREKSEPGRVKLVPKYCVWPSSAYAANWSPPTVKLCISVPPIQTCERRNSPGVLPAPRGWSISTGTPVRGEELRVALGGAHDRPDRAAVGQVSQRDEELAGAGEPVTLTLVEGGARSGRLRRVGADLSAKYVGFKCADDYHTSIDMATALHPQTQMTFKFDGEILPRKYGFPMKVRIPTKLGFKSPKHITALYVTNQNPGGYWEDQGYNWYSGS